MWLGEVACRKRGEKSGEREAGGRREESGKRGGEKRGEEKSIPRLKTRAGFLV